MDLEYKTLHSQTPMFADSKRMHEVLDQEARAGWQLYEKQDNFRLKLIRATHHRENDQNLDFDAYRSTIGVSALVTYGATALVTLAIVSVILYLALWNQA